MTEAKHTELPWRNFYEGSGDWVVIGEDGNDVCSVYREDAHFMSTGPGAPINEANSDFIVRSANSHYALVEALEALLDESSKRTRELCATHCIPYDEGTDAERAARATLKQAKGEL